MAVKVGDKFKDCGKLYEIVQMFGSLAVVVEV